MKWLLLAIPIVGLPAITAHSGTFLDDFSDGNLDGWNVQFSLEFPDSVKIENKYLVMNTTAGKRARTVATEIKIENEQNWDSYTLTCRVRFSSELIWENPNFSITVQGRKGQFDLMTGQVLSVLPIVQLLLVYTIPPDVKPDQDNMINIIRYNPPRRFRTRTSQASHKAGSVAPNQNRGRSRLS